MSDKQDDLEKALRNQGWRAKEAKERAKKATDKLGEDAALEDLFREAVRSNAACIVPPSFMMREESDKVEVVKSEKTEEAPSLRSKIVQEFQVYAAVPEPVEATDPVAEAPNVIELRANKKFKKAKKAPRPASPIDTEWNRTDVLVVLVVLGIPALGVILYFWGWTGVLAALVFGMMTWRA